MMKRFFISAISIYLVVAAWVWLFADSIIFLPPAPTYPESAELVRIKLQQEHSIVAVYHHNPESKYTILYSHGNAADLGILKYFLMALHQHGYSYLAYDYSGYGHSSGSPSESQSYEDVLAAYRYLIEQQKISPEHIVAYGHSLGAAVATNLAAANTVGALVLESPFVSAFRVRPLFSILPFDKFNTAGKLPRVRAPVLIMHSRDDPIIPLWHAEALVSYTRSPVTSAWFDGTGHDGISSSGGSYWTILDTFIQSLE